MISRLVNFELELEPLIELVRACELKPGKYNVLCTAYGIKLCLAFCIYEPPWEPPLHVNFHNHKFASWLMSHLGSEVFFSKIC